MPSGSKKICVSSEKGCVRQKYCPLHRVCSTTNNSSIITAPRIMSQAPRNARMMLKPQQVVTALCIMIKPLRTMLKVPRITLYRPRIMSQAPRIMLKAPRLSQASRILLNVSSTAYNGLFHLISVPPCRGYMFFIVIPLKNSKLKTFYP